MDFDTNSLTGKLSYYDNPNKKNAQDQYVRSQFDTTQKVNETDVYQIDAKINGNRFVGTAKSLINENTKTAPFIKQLFSGAANPNNPNPNSDTLEGGFYGKSGDELAGKFYPMTTQLMWSLVANETKRPSLSPQKRCILVQALKTQHQFCG